jgi:methylmalonyl-CoA/ethylmalonyl-CoA epimerase
VHPEARFHHVGYVVASIEGCLKSFMRSLDATWDGRIYTDPLQCATVTFVRPGAPENPPIELVEPLVECSPVTRFLNRGGGLHHVCYEVPDLEKSVTTFVEGKAILVRSTAPAIAFGGRPIAWIYTREGMLIELLQA